MLQHKDETEAKLRLRCQSLLWHTTHLLGIIRDKEEVQEVGISTQLAHDLHHTDALPQAAGR